MRSSPKHPVPSVMIPWIIALGLFFGVSAVTPDYFSGEKHGGSKEVSVSQVADHAHLSGHSAAPLLKLPAIAWSYCGLSAPTASLLRIDHSRDRCVFLISLGVAQGRAPPARISA
jgi:hypothetical protein